MHVFELVSKMRKRKTFLLHFIKRHKQDLDVTDVVF